MDREGERQTDRWTERGGEGERERWSEREKQTEGQRGREMDRGGRDRETDRDGQRQSRMIERLHQAARDPVSPAPSDPACDLAEKRAIRLGLVAESLAELWPGLQSGQVTAAIGGKNDRGLCREEAGLRTTRGSRAKACSQTSVSCSQCLHFVL